MELMRPNFAIHFSEEKAHVLHSPGGSIWHEIGELPTEPDEADPGNVETTLLRHRMAHLGGWSVATKIIIPNSLIWYTSCILYERNSKDAGKEVSEHLQSTTPFRIDELSYDWYTDGDRARIAYLLKQNLEEAEDFAMQWNLNPVSLEAIPPANSVYQQHAFFGLTKFAVNCGCSEAEYRKGLSATNSAVGNGGNARPLGQTVYWQQRATKLASKSIAVLTLLLCGLSSPAEAISDSQLFGVNSATDGISAQYSIPAPQRRRTAQLFDRPIQLGQRPSRRPQSGGSTRRSGSSPETLVDLSSPGASGNATRPGATSGNIDTTDPLRILADRGFDPHDTDTQKLAAEHGLGLSDTVQVEMIARIRQTVVQIDNYAEIQNEEPEAETPEPIAQIVDTPPQTVGSSNESIRQQFVAVLDPSARQQEDAQSPTVSPGLIVDLIKQAEDPPTSTTLAEDQPPSPTEELELVALAEPDQASEPLETEIEFERPRRRQFAVAAALPEVVVRPTPLTSSVVERGTASNAGIPLDSTPVLRRPETVPAVPEAVPEEAAKPEGNSNLVAVQADQPETPTRVARLEPEPVLPESPILEGRDYVVSMADEEITIDDNEASLIGIFGSRASRRALVRLSSGEITNLYVGASFKGGRVVEITRSSVIFEVAGKRQSLNMP